MNPSSPRRLTIADIREPLNHLDAEYRMYREASERYHSNAQKILKNVLDLLSKAKLRERIGDPAKVDPPTPESNPGKAAPDRGGRITDTLTRRELQVLGLIANGSSTKQVASTLGITFKTAVGHRSSLMKKLSIHDTASLVRYAIRSGIIEA